MSKLNSISGDRNCKSKVGYVIAMYTNPTHFEALKSKRRCLHTDSTATNAHFKCQSQSSSSAQHHLGRELQMPNEIISTYLHLSARIQEPSWLEIIVLSDRGTGKIRNFQIKKLHKTWGEGGLKDRAGGEGWARTWEEEPREIGSRRVRELRVWRSSRSLWIWTEDGEERVKRQLIMGRIYWAQWADCHVENNAFFCFFFVLRGKPMLWSCKAQFGLLDGWEVKSSVRSTTTTTKKKVESSTAIPFKMSNVSAVKTACCYRLLSRWMTIRIVGSYDLVELKWHGSVCRDSGGRIA